MVHVNKNGAVPVHGLYILEGCGRQNMVPQDVHVLSPRIHDCYFTQQKYAETAGLRMSPGTPFPTGPPGRIQRPRTFLRSPGCTARGSGADGLRPQRALCRRRGAAWGGARAGGPGPGPGPGPAPVSVGRARLPRPAPRPHGPVPPAARPPRRLLRPQLGGRLLRLPRLDGGLQTAGDRGHGGARRYHGARGCGEAPSAAAGGSSRAALPAGAGGVFAPSRPSAAQAPRGPDTRHPPAPRRGPPPPARARRPLRSAAPRRRPPARSPATLCTRPAVRTLLAEHPRGLGDPCPASAASLAGEGRGGVSGKKGWGLPGKPICAAQGGRAQQRPQPYPEDRARALVESGRFLPTTLLPLCHFPAAARPPRLLNSAGALSVPQGAKGRHVVQ